MSTALRAHLTASVLERSDYQRREVGYPDLERFMGGELEQYGQVYVGAHHITIPARKLKLVAYDAYPCPPGELAREYLRLVYEGVERSRPRFSAPGFTWNAPLYCAPGRGTLAYLDIAACYWQILEPLNPDDVILGDRIITGRTRWLAPDAVALDRELRHAIVGTIFASSLTAWRYGRQVTVKIPTQWANPSLRRYCMGILHSIAARARRRHRLYAWLTDAAIVDAEVVTQLGDELAIHWGLRSEIKAVGRGQVYNVSSYRVGDKSSRDQRNHRPAELAPFSNLRRVRTADLLSVRRRRWIGTVDQLASLPSATRTHAGGTK